MTQHTLTRLSDKRALAKTPVSALRFTLLSQPQQPTLTPASAHAAPPPHEAPRLRAERHRAPLLWLLIPFMAGLAIARISPTPLPIGWMLACALPLALAAVFIAPRRNSGLAALVAATVLSGAAAYEINRSRLADWETLPPREARITLRVTHVYPPNPQFANPQRPRISGLAKITAAEAHLRDLVGQPLYFSLALPLPAAPAAPILPTAEFSAIGVLEPLPRDAASDTFDGYLASSGMNFRFNRGRILAIEKPPSALATFYENARLRFSEILTRGLEHRPAQAGVLRAMVLGQKQDIGEEQTTLFLGSGTMHLFAISGLHIAVIAAGIQFLLMFMRLPRWVRIVAGTIALYLYVQITGATPSAMRAFVMVSLLQAAFLLRLPGNGIATLAFAALVTLVAAPMQLFSASFQMSYGIVAALLLYGLPLADSWLARWQLFRDIPKVTWTWTQHALDFAHRYLLGVVGIGVAASLVSAICSTIYFKLFTPGALFANLVLIPMSSMVILSGFLSILCGLIGLSPLSILFNHASALLLLTMEKMLMFFLKIPGVSLPAHFAPVWLGHATFAALLAAMLFGYANKWKITRGGFWPPVAVVILTLLLCVRFG